MVPAMMLPDTNPAAPRGSVGIASIPADGHDDEDARHPLRHDRMVERPEHPGEPHTELGDGRAFVLTPGTSYQVADGAESQRSSTATGATLLIVD